MCDQTTKTNVKVGASCLTCDCPAVVAAQEPSFAIIFSMVASALHPEAVQPRPLSKIEPAERRIPIPPEGGSDPPPPPEGALDPLSDIFWTCRSFAKNEYFLRSNNLTGAMEQCHLIYSSQNHPFPEVLVTWYKRCKQNCFRRRLPIGRASPPRHVIGWGDGRAVKITTAVFTNTTRRCHSATPIHSTRKHFFITMLVSYRERKGSRMMWVLGVLFCHLVVVRAGCDIDKSVTNQTERNLQTNLLQKLKPIFGVRWVAGFRRCV